MSRKSSGLSDLIWAGGLMWAGFQVVSALHAFRAGQQAPALQAQKDARLRDIHKTLERIERRLARG